MEARLELLNSTFNIHTHTQACMNTQTNRYIITEKWVGVNGKEGISKEL